MNFSKNLSLILGENNFWPTFIFNLKKKFTFNLLKLFNKINFTHSILSKLIFIVVEPNTHLSHIGHFTTDFTIFVFSSIH
jgi:hypothetical protein